MRGMPMLGIENLLTETNIFFKTSIHPTPITASTFPLSISLAVIVVPSVTIAT